MGVEREREREREIPTQMPKHDNGITVYKAPNELSNLKLEGFQTTRTYKHVNTIKSLPPR